VSAELKAGVRAALAGNLWIDDTESGIRTEDALIYIAAAQLKAVSIALLLEETPDGTREGWVMKDALSRHEASAAISGVAALLANARVMLVETESAASPAAALDKSEVANG
jgi:hypothetical protein